MQDKKERETKYKGVERKRRKFMRKTRRIKEIRAMSLSVMAFF